MEYYDIVVLCMAIYIIQFRNVSKEDFENEKGGHKLY